MPKRTFYRDPSEWRLPAIAIALVAIAFILRVIAG